MQHPQATSGVPLIGIKAESGKLFPWYRIHALGVFATAITTNAVYFFAGYELHQGLRVRLAMAASSALVYCIAALIGGRLVDRLGQRRVGAWAVAALTLVFIFGAWAVWRRSLGMLFAFLPLMNMCTGPLWPSVESAMTRTHGKIALSMRMTLYNLNWSSTGFVAACVAGVLAKTLSWAGLFLLAAGIGCVLWILMVRIAIPPKAADITPHEDPNQKKAHDLPLLNSPRSRKLLHMAWLSNMLAFVAGNTVTPFMPTITLSLGIKSYVLATALASIASLAVIVGFLITTLWTGWHYRIRWTLIPFVALVTGAVAMLLSQSLMMFVFAQLLYGVGLAMQYSGSIYYSMHLSAGAAEKAGVHEGLIGLGATLGPGLIAVAGAPNAIVPKAMALLVVLCVGGGALGFMASRPEMPKPTGADG